MPISINLYQVKFSVKAKEKQKYFTARMRRAAKKKASKQIYAICAIHVICATYATYVTSAIYVSYVTYAICAISLIYVMCVIYATYLIYAEIATTSLETRTRFVVK